MNSQLIAGSFDERIKHVAKQLLGVKLSEFALDTGDKLCGAFERQRQALMDLLQACQSDLDDILADDIVFPPVKSFDGESSREMDSFERVDYKRKLIDDSAQRLSQSVATLEKLLTIFQKLTGGGVSQAMLIVAKAGLERGATLNGPEELGQGETGQGQRASHETTVNRARFSAGRGAVIDIPA